MRIERLGKVSFAAWMKVMFLYAAWVKRAARPVTGMIGTAQLEMWAKRTAEAVDAGKGTGRIRLWRTWRVVVPILLLPALQACALQAAGTNVGHESIGKASSGQNSVELFAMIDQADMAYQRGQWRQASSHYQKVLQLIPDDPYIWFRLGNALTQQGQYNQAIYAFEASLQSDAGQPKPWFNLSTAYLLGAQLASLRAFEAMDGNDPGRAAAQIRLTTLTHLLQ